VEWTFGSGLSYTSFSVSALSVSMNSLDESGNVTVSVVVTNTGARSGKYSVLMFLFDMYRRVSPEYKLLKR
jgi:beta-glucosidase